MHVANTKDRNTVCDILANAYVDNPSILRFFDAKPSYEQLFKLFGLLLKGHLKRGHVYLTDSNMGVAVLFPSSQHNSSNDLARKLKIAIGIAGLKRTKQILKTQKLIAKNRQNIPHLYFWMLAVDPKVKGIETIQEIRDFSFELSAKEKLPLLAETPMIRTKILYERYGFSVYNKVIDPNGIEFYLMQRES